MSSRIYIIGIIALFAFTGAACGTTESADYTVRTEKWSRAPRDKFYRIVKVPKTPDSMTCEAGQTKPDDCPQK